jgi:hypothetical protein
VDVFSFSLSFPGTKDRCSGSALLIGSSLSKSELQFRVEITQIKNRRFMNKFVEFAVNKFCSAFKLKVLNSARCKHLVGFQRSFRLDDLQCGDALTCELVSVFEQRHRW